jgi:integrase
MTLDFLVWALLGGFGLALVAGPLGSLMVWQRLAYFGDTLAHGALLGVAAGLWLELGSGTAVMLTSLALAGLLLLLQRSQALPADTLLGILSHAALALGLVALALTPGARVNMEALLFGDLLTMTPGDVAAIWALATAGLAILRWRWNALVAVTVQEDLARVEGVRVATLKTTQRLLLAAVVAIGINALGYREVNPAGGLHNHLKPRKKGQQTALAAEELPTFLHALETYQGDAATRLGLRLLILTLARTSEVREAKWAEFDREEGVWTVPGERMKNRREHRVPLSQQALATLEELHKVSGHSQWLMPGRLEDKPASQNTMIFAVYRMGFHKRTTVHGFRALASTILNEAVTEVDGKKHRMWSVDAVERALAHTEQNKVKGAYDRGDRFEERTRMMQWWADYLDSVVKA